MVINSNILENLFVACLTLAILSIITFFCTHEIHAIFLTFYWEDFERKNLTQRIL